jgi:Zn-dependent protease with chaperone function
MIPPPDTLVAVPEPTVQALQYFRGNQILWIVNTLLGFAIPALFLFTGWSAKLRDAAKRMGRAWYPTLVLYLILFTVLTSLITLPLDFWSGFTRQHDYGMSNQTLGKWWKDFGIGMLVSLVLGAVTIWVPYLLIRKSPNRWWLWTAMVAVPGICGLILLQPIAIDPLFNDFGPMKNKELEQKILALADRAGIEGSRVYEVAKSEDTKAVNAYVTGFMDTKRIVLWDTTIAKLDERQLLFVMGHEMGHYVLGHIWKTIALAGFGIAFVLWCAHRLSRGLITRFRDRFGFTELSDVASLPLILLIANLIGFVVSPAALAYSRWQEHDSDRFGLEITKDNWAGASAFVKLQEENLGVPRPGLFYKVFRASHPPLGERVDFCNAYKPWATGEPMRHADRFKNVAVTPPVPPTQP